MRRVGGSLSEAQRVKPTPLAKRASLVFWCGRWDSNRAMVLTPRKLFILRSDRSDKNGINAEVRYTAGTRSLPVFPAEVCHAAH